MILIYKLKHTLTLIFIVLSLTLILFIGIFSNIFIKHNFNNYVKDSLNLRKESIYKDINNALKKEKNLDLIENIGINSLENGLIIKITDNEDNEIWNARTHNNGMCDAILKKMSSNMHKLNPDFKGNYTTDTYDLTRDGEKIGTLSIGYYGPYFYSDTEIIFFKTLHNLLLIIGTIYLIFSIFIGFIVSSLIIKPLLRVIKSTNLISDGKYEFEIQEKSKIKEMNQLVFSINKLSNNLKEQENIRRIMTKDISHELRTPLAVIQGSLEALIDEIWEPTPDRLESINKEIKRLTRLIDSLENLFKYESKALVLNREKIYIDELIKKIMTLFEKQMYDKNIKYDFEIEKHSINIDKDKISQAVINIISNSIKYTPENGNIFIKCFKKQGYLIISIQDTGIGISKEHLPYIFERFYRGDESRTRETGGSGIGLTISKAIIDSHGGKIIVKSKVRLGTNFFIVLKYE